MSGCGYRLAATIQANAERMPMPDRLSWAAVPVVPDAASDLRAEVDAVAAPLASALSAYGWTWLSNPAQAADADVLVRVSWMTEGPEYIIERADPQYRPGPVFGMGYGWWGPDPWSRGPFGYSRRVFRRPEPRIQTFYSRVLVVEALLANALPKAALEALLPAAARTAGALGHGKTPSGDLSKGPYAPPLSLDGPGAPGESAAIPARVVLWRVVVRSGGSKGNTVAILPQLAAAAAQAVGKNMQADVFVDSDLRVTFDN